MKTTRRHILAISGGLVVSAIARPGLRGLGSLGAHAQPIPGAPSFRGAAGESIQGPVSLNAGMTVLRAQHNGSANFSVTLFLPNPNETVQQSVDDSSYTDSSLVYNEIGAYKGGAVAMPGTPGNHFLAVTAGGAYSISVEQPVPGNVTTVQQTVFSGRGKDVTPYFMLPNGISQLSVQTSGAQFRGWLYHLDDLGGAPITDGINVYDGRMFDFTFPGNQSSYAINLSDNGPYLLSVDNIMPTDTWTYTFQ